ncbi:uncharacterized protein CELE_Y41D4B.6 [Caenorhabditis elegans]|uniref:Secreted protein n=1 Tax=Caenorhabditis elegans TaxID=6239 RepID=A0A3B1DQC8_CAEEL|nr:Secreted protein [Caenorhabditis elegans]VAY52355.1 Secreted protein [Caenorhabditis elegans]|eukprot:NP_001355430.1 Uncharacterized protein CELE_Y41D4B.6 [Caenorhabditis elegans]
MTNLHLSLILVIFSLSGVFSSGFLQIRLKSAYPLDTTVSLSRGNGSAYLKLPIALKANTTRELGRFPIEMLGNYSLVITGDKVEELGIKSSTYTASFNSTLGTHSPMKLNLPLNGLEIDIACDKKKISKKEIDRNFEKLQIPKNFRNWKGAKCDVPCQEKCTADTKIDNPLKVDIDYSIDLSKLPTFVQRLKETTHVDNKIRVPTGTPRQVPKEVSKETKSKESNSDALGNSISRLISSLKNFISGGRSSIIPGISVTMSRSDSESEKNDEGNKNEENTDSGITKHSRLSEILGSMRRSPPASFSVDDGPSRHSPLTFSEYLRSQRPSPPSSFSLDDGPSVQRISPIDMSTENFGTERKSQPISFSMDDGPSIPGLPGMFSPFGMLSSMMSRFPRSTTQQKSEFSGITAEDIAADGIIKN